MWYICDLFAKFQHFQKLCDRTLVHHLVDYIPVRHIAAPKRLFVAILDYKKFILTHIVLKSRYFHLLVEVVDCKVDPIGHRGHQVISIKILKKCILISIIPIF